jgi:hypothetical protein
MSDDVDDEDDILYASGFYDGWHAAVQVLKNTDNQAIAKAGYWARFLEENRPDPPE